jgi:hypothetical protein
MVKPRKNMSKITKQQEFTAKIRNIFLQKPGGCENCGGLTIEPCSVAITMNLATSSHGNGVIFTQNPPCFWLHLVD